jgi:hypothetical protein
MFYLSNQSPERDLSIIRRVAYQYPDVVSVTTPLSRLNTKHSLVGRVTPSGLGLGSEASKQA